MATAEEKLGDHAVELVRLEAIKTDRDIFFKAKKFLELTTIEHSFQIKKNLNHILQMDNYLDMYMPIKLQ